MKKFLSVMALFVISLLALSLVSAEGTYEGDSALGTVELMKVEVDGNEDLENLEVEEGDTLDVEVWFTNVDGDEDAEDIEVVVKLSNYEYGVLEETSKLFDVEAGKKKKVEFELTIPNDYKDVSNEEATLHILVFGGNVEPMYEEVSFFVESPENSVEVEKVYFAPGNTVQAGRSLLANVVVENTGEHTEDDVAVTVAIPALGVQATEVLDDVEEDDREDVPEMFLPIPANAEAGTYEVVVSVEYDNFHKTSTETFSIDVVANEMVQNAQRLVLAVGPQSQTVQAGSTAKYGVALANDGTSTQAYTLEVVSGDWGSASASETLVVLEPGKSNTVMVSVTPAAGTAQGQYTASVLVKAADGEVLETVPLTADVVAGNSSDVSLRNGLEIALIVLVVLLVIIGLIIGFSRLKRDDDEQTYY